LVYLARCGLLRAAGFILGLQSLSLRSLSRIYSTDEEAEVAFCPKDPDGRPVCPLCMGVHPDTWHYAAVCPVLTHMRVETRSVIGGILSSILPGNPPPVEFGSRLAVWLQETLGKDKLLFSNTGPPASGDGLRFHSTIDHLPMPSEREVLRPPQIWMDEPEGTAALLCPLEAVEELRRRKRKLRILFVIPRGRLRQEAYGGPQRVYSSDIALVLSRTQPLREISREAIRELCSILDSFVFLGALGLSLRWGLTSWQLDTVRPLAGEALLEGCGLLPLDRLRKALGVDIRY
jgi:hypothetical protein